LDFLETYLQTFGDTPPADVTADLQQVGEKHPFFALTHFAEARRTQSREDVFRASMYAPDRTLLKAYMEGKPFPSVNDSSHTAPQQRSYAPVRRGNTAFSIIDFDALPPAPLKMSPLRIAANAIPVTQDAFLTAAIKIKTVQLLVLVQKVRAAVTTFIAENPAVMPSISAFVATPPHETPTNTPRRKRINRPEADRLLDSFLESNPSLMRSFATLAPTQTHVTVQRSVEEDRELVSETLAAIYEQQGNVSAAIDVYKKLCLLFPNKRPYFEGKITQLGLR